MWDAYTVTNRYPNAQPLDEASPFPGANYVRNSVKVVMDAYDGTVRFFAAEPDEPILQAWSRIFPGLFEPISTMPAELQAHLRYPGGPVHRPEPVLSPLSPAGHGGRGRQLLQPGGPLGDPR